MEKSGMSGSFLPLIYRIDHTNKTARRTGILPDPSIDYVLRQMGWTVYADDQN